MPTTTIKVQNTNDSNSIAKNDAPKETKNSFKDVLQNTKESEDKNVPYVKEKGCSEDEKVIKALDDLDKKLESMDLSQIISLLSLLKIDPKDILDIKENMQKGNYEDIQAIVSKLIENTSDKQINTIIELMLNQNSKQIDSNIKAYEKVNSNDVFDILQNNEVVNTSDRQSIQGKIGNETDLKREIIAMLHKRFAEENLKQYSERSNDSLDSKVNKILPELKSKEYVNLDKKDLSNKDNTLESENLSNDKVNFTEGVSLRSTEKEDKLLKNLVNQEKPKGVKDTADSKITNVLARFEVSNLNKQEVVIDKPVINRTSMNMDLIKAVKYMDLNNLKELSVKVMPKDLGQIIIRLTMDNGIMKANITANSKETYDLLNSQLPTISNQLSEQNLSIQSFSLSLGNGDNFLFSGNEGNSGEGQKQKQKSYGVDAIEDDNANFESEVGIDSKVNLLA
ncbi:flagellar hook-length control protein [Clostridiales bacterium oral taxon 876 str. F0540]|nr:flagellar hook-length control protein [Clostridiales bacterium oral taxon 876 str. F0540]